MNVNVSHPFYFCFISHQHKPKNQLEKAVLDLLTEKARQIVPAHLVIKFQGIITDAIEQLNAQHSRCAPVQAYFWRATEGADYNFKPESICDFKMLRASQLIVALTENTH